MQTLLCGWLTAAILCGGATTLVAAEPTEKSAQPDIVLIMADDMGYSDLGCYGSEIATPHLDRLAAEGVRFTQFYNTARCCPTRAALLTGLYSHQAGVGHMVQDRGTPGYRGFLNDRCITLGEALAPAGYRTCLSGKWHVGEARPHWPVDRGFQHSYALVSGGTNYFRLDPNRILARDDRRIEPPADWYVTDAITDHAVSFIGEQPAEEPLLLYVGYTAPHWPLHARPEEIAKYRDKYADGWDALRAARHRRQIELGVIDPAWPLSPRDERAPAWEELDQEQQQAFALKMAVYAAQIDRLDQGIGRILEAIAARGRADNTLVIFLADNGGCAEEIDRGRPGEPPGGADSFLSYGLPWANASNTPFRTFKHWVHEGGISTPCIVRWPRVVAQPGTITPQVGHVIDLMATCLDAATAEYPKEFNDRPIAPLAGLSLMPILRGETRPGHEFLFWEHEGNRAVRHGDWKLVARHQENWELYDLARDRTEISDQSAAQGELVAKLRQQWDDWAARVGVEPWGRRNRAR